MHWIVNIVLVAQALALVFLVSIEGWTVLQASLAFTAVALLLEWGDHIKFSNPDEFELPLENERIGLERIGLPVHGEDTLIRQLYSVG